MTKTEITRRIAKVVAEFIYGDGEYLSASYYSTDLREICEALDDMDLTTIIIEIEQAFEFQQKELEDAIGLICQTFSVDKLVELVSEKLAVKA